MDRSGTSLALGIGLLIAAAVIVDAVFTGRKPWDIVLAVAKGDAVPKASAIPGASAPFATGNGAASGTGLTYAGNSGGSGLVSTLQNFVAGSASNSAKAGMAVAYALTQVGKPYSTDQRFGPGSFDCSGLTFMAAKAGGAIVGSNSYEQATNGTNVPLTPSAIRPGDLIFYKGDVPRRNLGHVAMAIDSTHQIAAPHHGTTVQVQPIRWDGAGPNSENGVQLIRRVF